MLYVCVPMLVCLLHHILLVHFKVQAGGPRGNCNNGGEGLLDWV